MNTAGPTISNDQEAPKQLSADSGEQKPLSKLNSVSKARKTHRFDQTLTTKVYASHLTWSFTSSHSTWQHPNKRLLPTPQLSTKRNTQHC